MNIEINENIGKTVKWITLSITHAVKEEDLFYKFEGQNCLMEFEKILIKNINNIEIAEQLSYYPTNLGLKFLNRFKSIETLNIRGGKGVLCFPSMNNLEKLKTIHINNQNKPTELNGLQTAQKLENLYIGDFTFGRAIEILNINAIVATKCLTKLMLSNVKVDFEELCKLKFALNLRSLTLNQKFKFEEFAELSVLLPKVKSNELKAWQPNGCNKGEIKINGRRKPYLNSKLNNLEIISYEQEFEALKKRYAM